MSHGTKALVTLVCTTLLCVLPGTGAHVSAEEMAADGAAPSAAEWRSNATPLTGAAPDAAAVAREPRRRAVLRLAWTDPADAAGTCATGARDTVDRLFKAMDVAVEWRRAAPAEPSREGEVRIILVDRGYRNADGHRVLGETSLASTVGRSVWVHVPSVAGHIDDRGCRPAMPMDEQRRRSVALGRVITHEVVHAVAPQVPHLGGLMASRFTSRELVCPALAIPAEAALAVRSALAARPASPSDPVVAAPSRPRTVEAHAKDGGER